MLQINSPAVCSILIILFLSLFQYCTAGQEGLFPSPGGPFYGIPFKGNQLLNFIPFTLTGSCEANKTYVLTRVEDFSKHLYELECIYQGSRLPSKVPQGSLFATCLTVMNSPILNPIIEALWKGKYIKEVNCSGTPTPVGWNAFFNGPTMPFIPSIGPHNLTVAPAENDDGRGGLVVEYSNDVMELCPELREEIKEKLGSGGVSGANIWSKAIPFMDVIRFVGKQEDGGNLYLLKTYLRDAFREDKMAVTTAFTVMLNYDEDAVPGAYFGMGTEPLAKPFNYMFPGLVDMMLRGLPLDNLLLTPVRTLGQIRKEAEATRRNGRAFMRDLPQSYRRLVKNGFDWMRHFRDIETQRRPRKEEKELRNLQE